MEKWVSGGATLKSPRSYSSRTDKSRNSIRSSTTGSQVDLVLVARGKLEREYTFMNLDLRKVLSLDQWRQLKSIRGAEHDPGNIIYFHKRLEGPGAGLLQLQPPDFEGEAPPVPNL